VKLIKYSVPGWIKEVSSEIEAATELWPHICGMCRKISESQGDEEEWDSQIPATEGDLNSMLGSACGCEYGVEYDRDEAMNRLRTAIETLIDNDDINYRELKYAYHDALNANCFPDFGEEIDDS